MDKWNELNKAQRLAAIGGVLVLVGSVLPWYSWQGFGVSGWSSGFLAILGIMGSVGGAVILVSETLLDQRFAIPSQTPAQSALVAACTGLALIILRLLTRISFISIGLILSIVGAVTVAYSAWRSVKERGDAIPFTGATAGEEG